MFLGFKLPLPCKGKFTWQDYDSAAMLAATYGWAKC